jgi:hypothetical protein
MGHWDSLECNVLRPLSADLAVASNNGLPEIFSGMVRYWWQIPEHSDWSIPLRGCMGQWRVLSEISSNF